MKTIVSHRAAIGFTLLLATLGCGGDSFPPPTESEVRQTIEEGLTETYLVRDGNALPDTITFEFGEIRIGEVVEKQMGWGEEARPVYPVKAPLDMTITYSNNPLVRKVEQGKDASGTFFFYRDAFGDWTFRIGAM